MGIAKSLTYLGDNVSVSGQCGEFVAARTRLGSVKFRECVTVVKLFESCVGPAILYGSDVRCVRLKETGIFSTLTSMVRSACGL